jgi:hypothetical protein
MTVAGLCRTIPTMPPVRSSRQAAPTGAWWSTAQARALLLPAQAAWTAVAPAAPGGQVRLCFRPMADWPAPDPAASFATTHLLHREGAVWTGPWRADAATWPLPGGVVARVDLCFALEEVPDPRALVAEAARALCPEGRLLVLGLNPLGAARWRWSGHGLRAMPASRVARWLVEAGLLPVDERRLGPRWRVPAGATADGPLHGGAGRIAWAILAIKREAALTPLRRAATDWSRAGGVPVA